MTNAVAIARALGGHRIGQSAYLCRCPVSSHGRGQGDRRPSMKVSDNPGRLDGIDVICFAGCDWREVKAELGARGLLQIAWQRGRRAAKKIDATPQYLPPPEPEPDPRAHELWHASKPIEDTLAERYLREHRRVAGSFPPSLRFIPDALYPPLGVDLPALVAAVARPDGRVVAVQLTYLNNADGSKAKLRVPRRTLGKLGTGAVRLGPVKELLGLAEGAETGLSAQELSGVPCWASIGGFRMARITIPATVREVHIFADADDAGRSAAEAAASQFSRSGIKVIVRRPPDGHNDYNDFVRSKVGRIG